MGDSRHTPPRPFPRVTEKARWAAPAGKQIFGQTPLSVFDRMDAVRHEVVFAGGEKRRHPCPVIDARQSATSGKCADFVRDTTVQVGLERIGGTAPSSVRTVLSNGVMARRVGVT